LIIQVLWNIRRDFYGVKKLATNGVIQMGLFDERNFFELKHPDLPGERLIACRNAELAHRRAIKRERLLQGSVKELG